MTTAQLDAMQAAASKRLAEFINRSAAQHLRAMRATWRAATGGGRGQAARPFVRRTGVSMRTIDDHKVNPGNDTLTITVLDEPGHGGANHDYAITGGAAAPTYLRFQNGPISADGNGVNGITHEALLAVLCDRLRGFQKGPYACKANACALTHIEEAQHWLQQRTIERMRRGVEGTHTV